MNPIIVATSGGASLGTGITTALAWVWDAFGGAVTTFNEYPVLWAGTAFGLAGACIGLLKRATRVGGRRR